MSGLARRGQPTAKAESAPATTARAVLGRAVPVSAALRPDRARMHVATSNPSSAELTTQTGWFHHSTGFVRVQSGVGTIPVGTPITSPARVVTTAATDQWRQVHIRMRPPFAGFVRALPLSSLTERGVPRGGAAGLVVGTPPR
ncbi:hypothetical protein [Streptomyces sp. NPDC037389]|uniref:hypothetical protein n=1 Tax=Streptomyces sp. NPDC037389 TaxID=3155369 RepID=UPI0034046E4D